nr:hypothetical protein [Tanacetum cinerariifolium]
MNPEQHQAFPGRSPNEAAKLRSWGCIGTGSGLQEIMEEELRGSRNYGGKMGRDKQLESGLFYASRLFLILL